MGELSGLLKHKIVLIILLSEEYCSHHYIRLAIIASGYFSFFSSFSFYQCSTLEMLLAICDILVSFTLKRAYLTFIFRA